MIWWLVPGMIIAGCFMGWWLRGTWDSAQFVDIDSIREQRATLLEAARQFEHGALVSADGAKAAASLAAAAEYRAAATSLLRRLKAVKADDPSECRFWEKPDQSFEPKPDPTRH